MLHAGESPESVIEYTPHGCRHVQVIVGTQLVLQGVLDESALDSLGHWEKGSKMPRLYDAAACVTELQTRKSISDVLRTGWRPAANGQLPSPATPVTRLAVCPATPAVRSDTPQRKKQRVNGMMAGSEIDEKINTTSRQSLSSSSTSVLSLVVLNTQRRKAHRVVPPNTVSCCGWWTCGSPNEPAGNAVFGDVGNARRCTKGFCG